MEKTDTIQLAHGGGGTLTRDLIAREIQTRFGDGPLRDLPDAALLPAPQADLVFSTDSFVVQPYEFPGGNIGDLAVHGTVNDLAAAGGRPLWLSLALILEEGFPMATLRRILDSVKAAAAQCGVVVATGDTKVVPRGLCDGIYVNTAGMGEKLNGFDLSCAAIAEGDCVVASGPIGDHGMAIMCARENIRIRSGLASDSAPVHRLVEALSGVAGGIRFMRDPTRGGVAAVLNEIVEGRAFGIEMDEQAIPVSVGTRAGCEMLGMDPLHLACEGRLLAVCASDCVDAALAAWRALPEGEQATKIGEATGLAGRVALRTVTGGRRLVAMPRGELLPRIC